MQINQVSHRFSWRYVSNFWWFWIYRWYYCGFLAGYLTQGIKYITRGLPQAVEGLKPTLIYPLLSVTITGLLMIYAFNPPATWLNNLLLNGLNSLSGSNIVLLGLVIGAMMAIDMGGPFNKAKMYSPQRH